MKPADIGKLGKYEIVGELGRGAMGVVYKGFDPAIERYVAIKTVRKDLVAGDEDATVTQVERFKREAKAAGRMAHPNIVGIYEYGEVDETAFIAMEFVEGRSLKDVFDADERFELPTLIRMMTEVLSALEYSHKNGIIHRDIKPANIMITKAGEVKITDFGIARLESSSLTQAGAVLGTPSYMSPEQFMGQQVDARSDLFSAGGVLYQLLTGEKPFTGSLTTIMHKVLNAQPEAPSLLNVQVPAALDAVAATAMAKRPDDRYQSAAAFARALKEACEGRGAAPESASAVHETQATLAGATVIDHTAVVGVAAAPPARRKGVPVGVVAAVLALVLIVVGGGAWWAFNRADDGDAAERAAAAEAERRARELAARERAEAERKARAEAERAAREQARQDRIATARSAMPALHQALARVPCSRLAPTVESDGTVGVSGSSGQAADVAEDRVRAAVAEVLGGDHPVRLALDPTLIPPTLCAPLDRLAGPLARARVARSPLAVLPATGSARFRTGDNLIINVAGAEFDAYTRVDYFTLEGYVVHLLPNGLERDNRLATGATRQLGRPDHGGRFWTIGPPFGKELIVVTASATPLFPQPRAEAELAADYLAALDEAINAQADAEPRTVAAALFIQTRGE